MTSKILVLGATGTVGGEVASLLARKGFAVRGATRDPVAAAARSAGAAEYVLAGLSACLTGTLASRMSHLVFLSSSENRATSPPPDRRHQCSSIRLVLR